MVGGQSPPPIAEAMLLGIRAMVCVGRGDPTSGRLLEQLRPLWPLDGLVGISGAAAEIDWYGDHARRRGDARRPSSARVEVVGLAWSRGVPGPDPADRAAARSPRRRRAPACRTADRADAASSTHPALLAGVDRVMQRVRRRKRPFGPEGVAWLERVHAEHLRLRWLADVDPPDADELVVAWERTVVALRADGAPVRGRPLPGPAGVGAAGHRSSGRGARPSPTRARAGRPGARGAAAARRASVPSRGARATVRGGRDADRRARRRSSGWSPRAAATARSPGSCSSAPRRSACTSPTSWPSSAPAAAPRPRPSPAATACSPSSLGRMLEAACWGLVGGVALLVGALMALYLHISTRFIGLVMGFGTGVLRMKASGRSARSILTMWSVVALICTAAAALGSGLLGSAPPGVIAVTQSFAAGAILTMLSDTMVPEAVEARRPPRRRARHRAGLRLRVPAVHRLTGSARRSHTRSMRTMTVTDERFEKMKPFGAGTSGRRLASRDLPPGPALADAAAEHRAGPVPPPVRACHAQEVRRRVHRAGHAEGLGARAVHPPRARQGDLRRRPGGLPRRQGQRDPRPDHGRALPAAPGLRRAQAGPQAADAGVQRRGPARLRAGGRGRSPRRRSTAGSRASRSGRSTG